MRRSSSTRLRQALALAVVLLLAGGTLAFAAALKKGASYTGSTVKGSEPISLKVSSSGRTVTASIAFAPQFCENGGGVGTKQITKPASISKSGSFQAKISYEFAPEHSIIATLEISGKFSGAKVSGKTTSAFKVAKQCDGTTSFSAKAR